MTPLSATTFQSRGGTYLHLELRPLVPWNRLEGEVRPPPAVGGLQQGGGDAARGGGPRADDVAVPLQFLLQGRDVAAEPVASGGRGVVVRYIM